MVIIIRVRSFVLMLSHESCSWGWQEGGRHPRLPQTVHYCSHTFRYNRKRLLRVSDLVVLGIGGNVMGCHRLGSASNGACN